MRKDYERLEVVEKIIKSFYGERYFSIDYPLEEDFEIDMSMTANTTGQAFKMEVKTVSEDYGAVMWENDKGEVEYGNFYKRVACRNNAWRWCATADTQEAFTSDTTPAPDFGDKPLIYLNAYDKNGMPDNAKVPKMLKEKAGLIVLTSKMLVIYTPKQFRKAIVGYGWNRLPHTKEYSDKSTKWEYKAIINLNDASAYIPLNNVPKHLVK